MRRRCLGMTPKEWSKTRLVMAWLAAMAAVFCAAGVWVVGQAQYVNHYCTSDRVDQPTPANPEALGGRPAYLDGPLTVGCEYDGYSTVTVADPAPPCRCTGADRHGGLCRRGDAEVGAPRQAYADACNRERAVALTIARGSMEGCGHPHVPQSVLRNPVS